MSDVRELSNLTLQQLDDIKSLYIKCRLASNFHCNLLSQKAKKHEYCSPTAYVEMKFNRMLGKWNEGTIIFRVLQQEKTTGFLFATRSEDNKVFLARACVDPLLQSQGIAKVTPPYSSLLYFLTLLLTPSFFLTFLDKYLLFNSEYDGGATGILSNISALGVCT